MRKRLRYYFVTLKNFNKTLEFILLQLIMKRYVLVKKQRTWVCTLIAICLWNTK